MDELKKRSEWCDQVKENFAFCVDEEMSYEEFVTGLFVNHFLMTRGCSTQNAITHAIGHLEEEYKKLS